MYEKVACNIKAYQEYTVALLVRENTRHHFPRVEIDIILQKSVEAVVTRNLKFWSHSQLGTSLLCTLDRLDNSGSIAL